jgi:hypothetical protein
MGGVNRKGDTKVSFLLSWIKREVAARALRHGLHPLVVGLTGQVCYWSKGGPYVVSQNS